ncbi:META domain-containing protein [Tabrizicola sp.]|uniref:META domain-containing protein n=1 Tax=Tabrizicola sp. TaxID=2005166 RepID=UPI002736FC70|nr:META domain-containing protein [Tabrizicola sp.]MDP3194777.1 META domain-containing protein [Tabrizicola sp.]
MRLLPVLAVLAMTACTAEAQDPTGVEWELLAIDGQVVDIPATLTVDAEGTLSGKAPCNRYTGRNQAHLPDLMLGGVAATRMACDRLQDEQVYFAALAAMTRLERVGDRTLVLTGPDGRSMEFARELMSTLTRCTTCPPKG